ncbi:MAG: PhoH family protein [Gammaproteobacteria bacterium]|nr:PhoH family protein [Gammaproteobacteria bacterium]
MSDDSAESRSTKSLNLKPSDAGRLATLCGPLDQNIRQLEQRLGIHIKNRGHDFQLEGPRDGVRKGEALLTHLYAQIGGGATLDPKTLHLYLQEAGVNELVEAPAENGKDSPNVNQVALKLWQKTVRPRGPRQTQFVRDLLSEDIDVNFAIGPAGTGKTYLAVACAVNALANDQVNRIFLVRPAVEVGEKLGFLPGDLTQKIDPYIQPLYDALFEMIGNERVERLIDRKVIEIAPLAYMRGRTLNEAFIILDESQNTTISQMKMFLTRIGFGSKVAITGDLTQIDLTGRQHGQRSGLAHVLPLLKDIAGIHITRFTSRDVVRHPIVQRIVDAYERDEQQQQHRNDGPIEQ